MSVETRQPGDSQTDRRLGESGTADVSDQTGWIKQRFPQLAENVSLPRWVVYAQAALLGLVGIGFFLFGILVGHFTSDSNNPALATFDCRVVGSVAYRDDGDLRADEGAVVLLLPKDRQPDRRSPGNLVNPASFQALDNPAIDRIHQLGGAVVTVNESGSFDVMIDANIGSGLTYYLLVISKHQRGVDTDQMSKLQSAVIGTFFVPVEDVIEDRSYYWTTVNAYEDQLHLPEIEF